MTKVSSRSAQPLSCLYGKGRNGPDNNAMNLTRSAQTDWGPRRLLQCWTGYTDKSRATRDEGFSRVLQSP